jgi:hypothetical protein
LPFGLARRFWDAIVSLAAVTTAIAIYVIFSVIDLRSFPQPRISAPALDAETLVVLSTAVADSLRTEAARAQTRSDPSLDAGAEALEPFELAGEPAAEGSDLGTGSTDGTSRAKSRPDKPPEAPAPKPDPRPKPPPPPAEEPAVEPAPIPPPATAPPPPPPVPEPAPADPDPLPEPAAAPSTAPAPSPQPAPEAHAKEEEKRRNWGHGPRHRWRLLRSELARWELPAPQHEPAPGESETPPPTAPPTPPVEPPVPPSSPGAGWAPPASVPQTWWTPSHREENRRWLEKEIEMRVAWHK